MQIYGGLQLPPEYLAASVKRKKIKKNIPRRKKIATTRVQDRWQVSKRKQRQIRRKDDRAFTKVAVAPGESVINNTAEL